MPVMITNGRRAAAVEREGNGVGLSGISATAEIMRPRFAPRQDATLQQLKPRTARGPVAAAQRLAVSHAQARACARPLRHAPDRPAEPAAPRPSTGHAEA